MDGALTISAGSGTGTVTAQVLPYGAHLVQLDLPDRDGKAASCVVSLGTAGDYRDRAQNPYLGSVVGRWANRIADARFPLEYFPVEVVPNEGPHQLHGGPEGWDRKVWDVVEHDGSRLVLGLVSPDGDQGFPGTVTATVTYELSVAADGRTVLELVMAATADRSTPVNMTTHTYWNLTGDPAATVEDHRLTVPADWTVEVDDELLPTGRLPQVDGTPFDLREGPRLGDVLRSLVAAEGRGLDRSYLLTHSIGREVYGLRTAAELYDPVSGRSLVLQTNQDAVHLYVPEGPVAGRPARAGVCLETGQLPDALNRPGFKPKVLRVNGEYRHVHRLTFGTS
jgi:aldose 1-epimerase